MKEKKSAQRDEYGSEIAKELLSRGIVEFTDGFPEGWRWPVFDFVASYHAVYNEPVIAALDSLRAVWKPQNPDARFGAFAAEKVSRMFKQHGVQVFTPHASVSSFPECKETGPRFYVSITQAACKHFGTAPPPPSEINKILLGHPKDQKGSLRIRGLGWTLAPPGSDPQDLHSDIWGGGKYPRDRVRYPHFLWKPDRNVKCTTEIVPGVFPEGCVEDSDYDHIQQVKATALLVDGEVLHRGAATSPALPNAKWPSTLSIELCTPTGWKVWMAGGGDGAQHKQQHLQLWRMLRIHCEAQHCPAGHQLATCWSRRNYCDKCARHLAKGSKIFRCSKCDYTECQSCYNKTQNNSITDDLPLLVAPNLALREWKAAGLKALRKEQNRWEEVENIDCDADHNYDWYDTGGGEGKENEEEGGRKWWRRKEEGEGGRRKALADNHPGRSRGHPRWIPKDSSSQVGDEK